MVLNEDMKERIYPLFDAILDTLTDILYPGCKDMKSEEQKEFMTLERFKSLLMIYNITGEWLLIKRNEDDFEEVKLVRPHDIYIQYMYYGMGMDQYMILSEEGNKDILDAIESILDYLKEN